MIGLMGGDGYTQDAYAPTYRRTWQDDGRGFAVEAVLCCPRSGHWSWRVSRVDRHGQNDAARLRTTLAHGVKTCYSDAGIAAGAVVADVLRAAAN